MANPQRWNIREQVRIAKRSAWLKDNGEKLILALAGLLDDTQHAEHKCGDRDCPVAKARRLVKACPKLPNKVHAAGTEVPK